MALWMLDGGAGVASALVARVDDRLSDGFEALWVFADEGLSCARDRAW